VLEVVDEVEEDAVRVERVDVAVRMVVVEEEEEEVRSCRRKALLGLFISTLTRVSYALAGRLESTLELFWPLE
jgi:hypothetical protein